VRRVRTIGRITRVPGIPRFYRGVVNVRGQVITVLDMRLFFEMPAADDTHPPQELVVVQSGRLEVGLLAHNVQGVRAVPRADIEPVDNIRYALGITIDQLVLLDVPRLFEDERLLVGSKDEG
jgi:purine-binding chemotaxis protein CheW